MRTARLSRLLLKWAGCGVILPIDFCPSNDRPDSQGQIEMAEAPPAIDDHVIEAPPFAVDCANASEDAWGASFDHPFVVALANGSLDSERFRFYQMQDARYLEAFADACSIISTRCEKPETKLWFIDAARLAIVVEQQLHAGYGETLGYTPDDIRKVELTPNNKAYQDHMISAAARASLVEAIAAITPCPWLYTDLGQHLQADLGEIPNDHPYADWLRTYSDPGFVTYTNELLRHLQVEADRHDQPYLDRARAAFAKSVRFEWMFWDQAWRMQRWPL